HGERDDLLGEEIDLARLHDRFEPRPAQLQMFRVGCQRPPNVWYPVDPLGRLDVLKDRANSRVAGILVDELDGTHGAELLSVVSPVNSGSGRSGACNGPGRRVASTKPRSVCSSCSAKSR